MNDFTKEELGEIFWIIEGCTMDYIGKENNALINKIQSMIKNYDEPCKHPGLQRLDMAGMTWHACVRCNYFKRIK